MLTDQQIENFQELYRVNFREEISRVEAMEKGIQLVRLMSLVYKPMTPADLQMVLKRQDKIFTDLEQPNKKVQA